jgi:hypothetical protein
MKPTSWIIITIPLLLVAATVTTWTVLPTRKAVQIPPATTVVPAKIATISRSLAAQTSMPHRATTSASSERKPKDDIKQMFRDAKDYFALAKIDPAASERR